MFAPASDSAMRSASSMAALADSRHWPRHLTSLPARTMARKTGAPSIVPPRNSHQMFSIYFVLINRMKPVWLLSVAEQRTSGCGKVMLEKNPATPWR